MLISRIDIDKYKNGIKDLNNFIPFPCAADGNIIVGHWPYQNVLLYERTDILFLHEYI